MISPLYEAEIVTFPLAVKAFAGIVKAIVPFERFFPLLNVVPLAESVTVPVGIVPAPLTFTVTFNGKLEFVLKVAGTTVTVGIRLVTVTLADPLLCA